MLALREHSRQELARKLRIRGFAPLDVAQVLDDLARRGLQSDERFAESFVGERCRRGSGPMRIRAELRQRGICDSLIEHYLNPDPEWWADMLKQVHDRKYGPERPESVKELARRVRFLQHRGFTIEQVRRFLRGE